MNAITSAAALLGATLVVTTAAMAQAPAQSPVNDRVRDAMQKSVTKYGPPGCSAAKGNHYKVSSAASYLKTAIETSIPENKTRALESGHKVVLEAITENKQATSPGAWYYLGRIDFHRGDLVGGDSALTKALELAPDCKDAINQLRMVAWISVINPAITFLRERNSDSATVLYRQANIAYPSKPQGFSGLGLIFGNAGQTDSAIAYLRKAMELASDSASLQEKAQAAFNLGVIYEKAGRHDEAIEVLEQVVKWSPNDQDAKLALAVAYRNAGRSADAGKVDSAMTAPPTPGGKPGEPTINPDLGQGIELYNNKDYAGAIAVLDKVLANEPNNTDAIRTQANAYLALGDGKKLVEIADRLVALEPLSKRALELVREGYRLQNNKTKQTEAAEKVLALPVSITISSAAVSPSSAKVSAMAEGVEPIDAKSGKPIKVVPMTLTFELLDRAGNIVITQDVEVPALTKDQTQLIMVDVKGKDIIAWRYKVKA